LLFLRWKLKPKLFSILTLFNDDKITSVSMQKLLFSSYKLLKASDLR